MSQLTEPVAKRDHIQGSLDSGLILLEYGDYECPHCKLAFPVVKAVQAELGHRLCFAFRHFPLIQIHPHAELAAESAEAAGAQDRFWEMHETLLVHSPVLDASHLLAYAEQVNLDIDRFRKDRNAHRYLPRVQEDIASGARNGVAGTPTFFINGVKHRGGYDLQSLLDALQVAP